MSNTPPLKDLQDRIKEAEKSVNAMDTAFELYIKPQIEELKETQDILRHELEGVKEAQVDIRNKLKMSTFVISALILASGDGTVSLKALLTLVKSLI